MNSKFKCTHCKKHFPNYHETKIKTPAGTFCGFDHAFQHGNKLKKNKVKKINKSAGNLKHGVSVAKKKHLQSVAELGCIACKTIGFDDTPAELHHIRYGQGMAQRSSHYEVIPLCPEHHRYGKNAIHQSKVNFERNFGTEIELLRLICER